jgi:hypothetical protein
MNIQYKTMDKAKLTRLLRYIDRTLLHVEAGMVSRMVIRESTNLQTHDDCQQLRRELSR